MDNKLRPDLAVRVLLLIGLNLGALILGIIAYAYNTEHPQQCISCFAMAFVLMALSKLLEKW